ncbi:uncharacterized protein BO96DRAFT_430152 [Aspergillus niger CBS 101883]|uniref:uncharacterized protein n=1 Tax=Aspergillus lacticoffeatus (strain CBS 101883) TaxID=1450533 RepID=UPI000D8059A6|nr:uncharacterized protein BO96DRAFT_430152 [Aspergillus niger CBS 101883]PYH61572.1 hypothetical protein BO96DRAFT_430152 [Aspergillus niger CBS 101883]
MGGNASNPAPDRTAGSQNRQTERQGERVRERERQASQPDGTRPETPGAGGLRPVRLFRTGTYVVPCLPTGRFYSLKGVSEQFVVTVRLAAKKGGGEKGKLLKSTASGRIGEWNRRQCEAAIVHRSAGKREWNGGEGRQMQLQEAQGESDRRYLLRNGTLNFYCGWTALVGGPRTASTIGCGRRLPASYLLIPCKSMRLEKHTKHPRLQQERQWQCRQSVSQSVTLKRARLVGLLCQGGVPCHPPTLKRPIREADSLILNYKRNDTTGRQGDRTGQGQGHCTYIITSTLFSLPHIVIIIIIILIVRWLSKPHSMPTFRGCSNNGLVYVRSVPEKRHLTVIAIPTGLSDQTVTHRPPGGWGQYDQHMIGPEYFGACSLITFVPQNGGIHSSEFSTMEDYSADGDWQ